MLFLEAYQNLGNAKTSTAMLILEDLKPGLPLVGLESASVATIAAVIPISDADGAAFPLTCEAKRIDLAFLFDPMMAVHTSNVDPLPHQITAVHESMLHKQPLRFVLADDLGAGKTIMAGLCIRELIMRWLLYTSPSPRD